ncbi:major facilitator superfamily domain-containing protein [Aspergillus germanicus]
MTSYPSSRGWRFWVIIAGLSVTSLLTAVESTVTSTALPTISWDLNAGESYIWFVNAFFLSSTAFQPLYGQLAHVLGQRWPLISAVVLFALGSGISGGASSTAMLIAGRLVQGIGLGGVNMLIDIVVCDLVPLRERGQIMAVVFVVFSVGSSIGPFVGGAFTQHVTWRWAFYISLPIAGGAMLIMLLFLQVHYQKQMTFLKKLQRIDWVGNIVLIVSVVAILIALSFGGTTQPWSSWRVLLPLLLGLAGLAAFHAIQTSPRICPEPTIPPRLFSNRTSVAAFILSFLHGTLLYWKIYFLSVYFQSVLQSSPARSDVQLLPTVIVFIPGAILGGVLITKLGRYKPIQIVGFALMALGLALFALLDESSTTSAWVGFQIFAALGSGLIITSTLPAVQAELAESDVATSTATWAFLRSFGSVRGVAIPAAIFNNRFLAGLERAGLNGDPRVALLLGARNAYQEASGEIISSLPEGLRPVVVGIYADALRWVWRVSVIFAGLGFLVAWLEREVELRTTLETEFGIDDDGSGSNPGVDRFLNRTPPSSPPQKPNKRSPMIQRRLSPLATKVPNNKSISEPGQRNHRRKGRDGPFFALVLQGDQRKAVRDLANGL